MTACMFECGFKFPVCHFSRLFSSHTFKARTVSNSPSNSSSDNVVLDKAREEELCTIVIESSSDDENKEIEDHISPEMDCSTSENVNT